MEYREWNDACEPATETGFRCKTCKHFYIGVGAERAARFCHGKGRPCAACGSKVESRSWLLCNNCREKKAISEYMAREARPWDGEQMLCLDRDDRFFSSIDDLLEHISECENREVDELTQELAEHYRVRLTEPQRPRPWSLPEAFDSYLANSDDSDAEPPGEWKKAEDAVNAYLASCEPWSWSPGRYRLLVEAQHETD